MTLADVALFRVPKEAVSAAEDALQEAGRSGYERFVLWTGMIDGAHFVVQNTRVPRQKSYKIRGRELLVRVEGDALHELNAQLYQSRQVLAIQIHAHPTEAYHSDTDDGYPIVTTLGGISIVVPDFCRRGLIVPGTAFYRLSPRGWEPQDASIMEVIS